MQLELSSHRARAVTSAVGQKRAQTRSTSALSEQIISPAARRLNSPAGQFLPWRLARPQVLAIASSHWLDWFDWPFLRSQPCLQRSHSALCSFCDSIINVCVRFSISEDLKLDGWSDISAYEPIGTFAFQQHLDPVDLLPLSH